jgi:D-aminopeptidase
MTGTAWIEESGFLAGPVMITNTHSVGIVRDTVIEWLVKTGSSGQPWALPVVAETWDGWLNDINGFHVGREHTFEALNTAHDGPVAEGNVGGGTGMIGYGFKGGIGTASRVIDVNQNSYVLGTIVQLNCGRREELTVAGVPVGRELLSGDISACEKGSIVVIVATDAPLLPHQLKRLARRATMGLARTGSVSGNFSGDIFLAFSTANLDIATKTAEIQSKFLSGNSLKSHMCLEAVLLPNEAMDPLFTATVESTEEAIINALIAAETMVGIDGHRLTAIPHKDLCQILNSYGRLCLSPNES